MKKNAFTLIEILISISIIGILFGIIYIAINPAKISRDKYNNKVMTDLNKAGVEADLLYNDYDFYTGICTLLKEKGWAERCDLGKYGATWAATHKLANGEDEYCVDSSGWKKRGFIKGSTSSKVYCGDEWSNSERCENIGGDSRGYEDKCYSITKDDCTEYFPTWEYTDGDPPPEDENEPVGDLDPRCYQP